MHHATVLNSDIRRRRSSHAVVVSEVLMSPQKPSTYPKSEEIDIRCGKCFYPSDREVSGIEDI